MSKKITLLGSTGSIGRQTLDVAEQLGLRVAALTANSNVERMEAQCRKFRPRLAVMTEEAAAKELAVRLQDTSVKVLAGTDALVDAAVIPEAETVVTAVVGMVGLKATLAAIREKKRIALANKETLVCAGELVMSEADRCGAEIVPVDSEHSAIFQCLQGCADRREIRRLILTCSGGPFRGMGRDEVGRMTKADALRHPNWTMGPKITVDCSTLMNKGLEVIEAMRLYGLPLSQVDVVIHRQSIVHSLVEFRDGAVLAQLGVPDMRVPIRLALTYPNRAENPAEPLDLFLRQPFRVGVSERVHRDARKEIEVFIAIDVPDVRAFAMIHNTQRSTEHVHVHPGVLPQPLGVLSAEVFQLFSCHTNSSFQYRLRERPWFQCRLW